MCSIPDVVCPFGFSSSHDRDRSFMWRHHMMETHLSFLETQILLFLQRVRRIVEISLRYSLPGTDSHYAGNILPKKTKLMAFKVKWSSFEDHGQQTTYKFFFPIQMEHDATKMLTRMRVPYIRNCGSSVLTTDVKLELRVCDQVAEVMLPSQETSNSLLSSPSRSYIRIVWRDVYWPKKDGRIADETDCIL